MIEDKIRRYIYPLIIIITIIAVVSIAFSTINIWEDIEKSKLGLERHKLLIEFCGDKGGKFVVNTLNCR